MQCSLCNVFVCLGDESYYKDFELYSLYKHTVIILNITMLIQENADFFETDFFWIDFTVSFCHDQPVGSITSNCLDTLEKTADDHNSQLMLKT